MFVKSPCGRSMRAAAAALCCAISLSSCGGGDSGSPPPVQTPAPTPTATPVDLVALATEVMTNNPSPMVWERAPTRNGTPAHNPGKSRYFGAPVDDPFFWPFLDIIAGLRGGVDVFMTVRTEEARPGAGEVDGWSGTDWEVPEREYGVGAGDQPGDYFVLGDSERPYYAGKTDPGDTDRDLVYIVNQGREWRGSVFRLHGSPQDYELVAVRDPGAPPDPSLNPDQPSPYDGVALFFTRGGINDMIAHFDESSLADFDLNDTDQFVFDSGVNPNPVVTTGAVAQLGGPGAEGWGGWTTTAPDGSVYQIGLTSSDDLGQPSTDSGSFYLAKFNAAGNRVWIRKHGSDINPPFVGELPYAIYATNDAVFVSGGTKGAYGGPAPEATLENGQHPFVAKFDASTGDELAVRQLYSGPEVNANAWQLNGAGDEFIIVVGGVSAPGIARVAGLPDTSPFLHKLRASDLSEVWSTILEDGPVFAPGTTDLGLAQVSNEAIGGVVYVEGSTPGTGTVYVSGYSSAGPLCGNKPSVVGAFMARYDDNGISPSLQWCDAYGAEFDHQYPWRTRIDSSGDIYAIGQTNGSIDGQSYAGGGDTFIRKYSPDGTVRWTRLFGGSGSDGGYSMDIRNDVLFVTGGTWSPNWISPGRGLADVFLLKLDTDGNLLQSLRFGTEWYDFAVDVTAGDRAIHIGGMTEGSMAGPHQGPGGPDAFLVRLCGNDFSFAASESACAPIAP